MHETNLLEDQPIAWTPTPDVIERAQLTKFMKQVGVSTWDDLYEFSVRDVEKFTEEVLKFLDIKFDPPYEKLLDTSAGIEFPVWFRSADTPVRMDAVSAFKENVASSLLNEDEVAKSRLAGGTGDADKSVRVPSAGLNITEMCLDRWQTDEMKDQPAVIWEGEAGVVRTISYGELFRDVEACANGLRFNDINKGDAVVIHLPMMIETVVALLAVNRIGAIAVPVFSGYGVEAIASRINAVEAFGIFMCDGFPRRGKFIDSFQPAFDAMAESKIECVVLVDTLTKKGDEPLGRLNYTWCTFDQLQKEGLEHRTPDSNPEPTSAEDPLIILYTSGTTGKPKGIAHTHASFPIKAAQDMAFGTDVGKGTRISWYTDIGWMMGPWLIYGALINGATICIYDGAPDYPTADRMWEFCAKHKVEILGISPTLIRSLAAAEGSADAIVRVSTPEEQTNPEDAAVKKGWHSRGYLPHYDGNVTQFVSFRLADSLPQSVLRRIKAEIDDENPADPIRASRIKVEEYLDSGAGECILAIREVAEIVRDVILNENVKTCRVDAWVLMPNHAHILLRPNDDSSLSAIMKTIKSVSSHRINKLLGRTGPVWQPDYFDRYVRDWEHYQKTIAYIENNPVKAGLCSSPGEWEFSSAGARTPSSASENYHPAHADDGVRAPFERHDLSSLRIFASTGEPWNPAPWWWLFEKVGDSKLPIINYSGGTEIAGGILMGNPLLPIKPCSFPAPCPGMDVDILDEDGNPVGPGKVGELVIKQPWIGMARGFWQEKERYLDTYWRRFKDIWVHGDFAMRDKDGHWFILGRSDDTLKVAGKRVGPAEVESLLVAHPLVTEAAVIGVPDEVKGTAMVAFVVRSADAPSTSLAESPSADDGVRVPLETELKALVAKDMGKPLAPSRIHFVSALPKTRNAKVMRRVIRAAYLGEDPGDLSALENPQSVTELQELARDS
jgi:acyl-coenzyme A synthetase/AMP-(fatty) acid ligase/REP element-mobilizing transposase RayT